MMDDLNCEGVVLQRTLKELEIINRWLGGNAVTLNGLSSLLNARELKELTVADLGCGRGDMLMLVSDWGRGRNISISGTGFDANPHIVAYARAHSRQCPGIRIETGNIFSPEIRAHNYDVFLATLFLHHFDDDRLVDIFRWMNRQARIGIVINDIHRHWLAYYSIRWLTRWFSRSAMVKFDAPLSVCRAFTRRELTGLLNRAGIERFALRWKWAFRWQLIIWTT